MALTVLLSVAVLMLPKAGHAQAAAAGQWKNANQMFTSLCSPCHTTGVGPELRGRHLLPNDIVSTVRHGKRQMPPFRPTDLSDAELRSLAQMISTSAKPPETAVPKRSPGAQSKP